MLMGDAESGGDILLPVRFDSQGCICTSTAGVLGVAGVMAASVEGEEEGVVISVLADE